MTGTEHGDAPPSRVARLIRRFAVPVVIVVALSAGGLAMCGLPGDSLDDDEGIVGTYVVNGVDPAGVDYSGTVHITRTDDGDYLLQWIVTGSIQSGVGELSGNVLRVDWSTDSDPRGTSSGTAEYVVGDDGGLRGERFVEGVDAPGTEEIFPEP